MEIRVSKTLDIYSPNQKLLGNVTNLGVWLDMIFFSIAVIASRKQLNAGAGP
jgi:hypothetical protein